MANKQNPASAGRPKAYSYLRFSTPEQARGDSYRRQTALAEEYARRHQLRLDDKLTFQDLGVSAFRGKNAADGRLGDFLSAVRVGEVERGSFLLVESLDRISRQTARKALRTLEQIVEEGVTVVTLSDGKAYDAKSLDEDPMSLLWSILIFMRAHEESAMKARRLKAAWAAKRERAKDRPLTARTPAWTRVNEGQVVVDSAKVKVVRRIFALAREGAGQEAIARTLNAEGVKTFGKAKYWQRSYVAKLLANRAVVGDLVPHLLEHHDGKRHRVALKPIANYYPQVIDRDEFDALQKPKSLRLRTPKGDASVKNVFATLARCSLCGAAMTRVVKGRKARPKLVCTNAKVGGGCSYHSVDLENLEQELIAFIPRLVRAAPSGNEKLDKALKEVDTKLQEAMKRASRLIDSVASGWSSRLLHGRIGELEGNIDTLVATRRALGEQIAASSPRAVKARLEELTRAAASHSNAMTNLALRALFSRIDVDYQVGALIFHWRHGGESMFSFVEGVRFADGRQGESRQLKTATHSRVGVIHLANARGRKNPKRLIRGSAVAGPKP